MKRSHRLAPAGRERGGARPADTATGENEDALAPVRLMLLALVMLGSLGLLLELLLLEHFEDAPQLVPIALLVAALATGIALAARPSPTSVRAFQAVMIALVGGAAVGIYLHLTGNVEFELEMDASLGGIALLWTALRGATPALAPGALAQLGLVGLILTYRHPGLAMRRDPTIGRGIAHPAEE